MEGLVGLWKFDDEALGHRIGNLVPFAFAPKKRLIFTLVLFVVAISTRSLPISSYEYESGESIWKQLSSLYNKNLGHYFKYKYFF